MTIIYGEPFPTDWVTSFPDDKEGYLAITAAVMERIGRLREQVANLP
jgi:hypothetical protein